MALKVDKRCKICQRCLAEPAFVQRLFRSRAYVPGGESLMHISQETGLHYNALGRHTKKHQGISNYELTVAKRKILARKEANAIVKQRIGTADARQDVLDQLTALVADHGEIKIGQDITLKDAMALILKSAKDADDVAAKKKDQELDVFKLMTSARSGATPPGNEDEPFDPWVEGQLVE